MRVRIRHLVLLDIVVWGMVACSHLSLNAGQDPASDHQPDDPPPLFLTLFNSYEESELKEWNEIGRYRNYGVYSTNVMSRLVDVLRTESNRVSKITFQINLLGKDVGSYEVEYRCNKDPRKGGLVIREHTIPVPTTPSVKWMSSNFEDNYLTNVKRVATYRYCMMDQIEKNH